MVTEEKDLKNQIEQRVIDFTNKIHVLTEELGLPQFQVLFISLLLLILHHEEKTSFYLVVICFEIVYAAAL